MRRIIALALLATAAAPPPLAPGVWTNGEERYFAGEAGRPQPDWFGIEVGEDGRWRAVDAYGEPLGEWRSGPPPGTEVRTDGTAWVTGSLGSLTEMRRANPFRCWMSLRKFAARPDGSEDWDFHSGLMLHDQDGRAKAGGGGGLSPETIFRLRRVIWPSPSTNKPSLVLYVHRPDAPGRAVSYAWADPEADLIGINLRWVQGSCTRVSQPTASVEADRALLAAAGQQWNALYSAGDWDALRALYEDDAWLMTDRAPAQTSADAIVAYLRRFGDSGAKVDFRFEPEDIRVERPFGFVTAKYWMTAQVPGRAAPVRTAGRSLLIYKWCDGAWRLWRDMDNTTSDVAVGD